MKHWKYVISVSRDGGNTMFTFFSRSTHNIYNFGSLCLANYLFLRSRYQPESCPGNKIQFVLTHTCRSLIGYQLTHYWMIHVEKMLRIIAIWNHRINILFQNKRKINNSFLWIHVQYVDINSLYELLNVGLQYFHNIHLYTHQ